MDQNESSPGSQPGRAITMIDTLTNSPFDDLTIKVN
jgi:hypothetical protein